MPQRVTKNVGNNDCCDQGDDRHATTMAAPSASQAADANNIKDEDARETKEDDGDNVMLGTNEVRCIGATPAALTTPNLVTGEVDQGFTACCPTQQCCSALRHHPTTMKGISHSSTYSNSSRP